MSVRETLDNFFRANPSVQFGPGTPIIEATEKPGSVFYLREGYVRQYVLSADGTELTTHIFKTGSFFPLMQAFELAPNRQFYDALTSVSLAIAPTVHVRDFLLANPDVLYDLTQRLLLGLDGLLVRLEVTAFGSAKVRVADGLLFLAKHFGRRIPEGLLIDLPTTHKSLSHIVGLTRETTSLEIERLTKAHILAKHDELFLILDPTALEAAATF